MRFVHIQPNIAYFMRLVGYAIPDQLVRFFSDYGKRIRVEYYIEKLVELDYLVPVEGTNVLKYRKALEISKKAYTRRIEALWVLAAFRSRQVADVYTMTFPAEIGFVSVDDQTYDISVCANAQEAKVGMQKRESGLPLGEEDATNHIVVVPDQAVGRSLQPYGYDSFCTLDQYNSPRYFTW